MDRIIRHYENMTLIDFLHYPVLLSVLLKTTKKPTIFKHNGQNHYTLKIVGLLLTGHSGHLIVYLIM
ncbi:hypothetical protein [Neobacillus sp. 19]|uniref:hypothetical protein n=1 Tax=Neobacillus sp. 19 TaxID=3394458 RepID=UPI003C2B848F